MVSRAWILLIIVSCKAADLGIELLPTGLEAISQEDLKRDFYLRSKARTRQQVHSWMHKRLGEMGLESEKSDGKICGHAGIEGDEVIASVYDDDSIPAMLSSASLITLAKVFDKSPRRRRFCFVFDEIQLDGIRIGDLRGEVVQLDLENKQAHSLNMPEYPDEINYQRVASHLKIIGKELVGE